MDPLAGLFVLSLSFAMEEDKQKHVAAGAITSVITQQFTDHPLAPCATSLLLGVAKEAYDSQTGGDVEAGDVLATTFGCAVTFRF